MKGIELLKNVGIHGHTVVKQYLFNISNETQMKTTKVFLYLNFFFRRILFRTLIKKVLTILFNILGYYNNLCS